MTTFADFLRDAGLNPGAIVADGRWRRCPTADHPRKKNGAYCLAADGLVGWLQDWAVHDAPLTWRPEGAIAGKDRAAPDYLEIRRRNEAADAERRKAIEAAEAFYRQCQPLVGGHEYLTAHGLDMTGCRGLKVDRDGWLVVPMGHKGKLWSVQRIAADGAKRFWFGAPTIGASYTVERHGATLTVLCEGLATGLAIYAAVPLARVVVTFTSGNLPRVAAQLPRLGMVCIAADNDTGTEAKIGKNPGLVAAREAAEILGCDVAVPDDIDGTDFCDMVNERTAARMATVYGKRTPSVHGARRVAQAEIARIIMRSATFRAA